MSKINLTSLSSLRSLKIDNSQPSIKHNKAKEEENQVIFAIQKLERKRREKRLLKSIKNLGDQKDEVLQHFTFIQKSQNSVDKSVLAKSLSSHFVFSSLVSDKNIRETLIEQFKLCKVQEGQYLFKQNDEASSFFVLHDGKMLLQINGQTKKKLSPGECFGELALLYSSPRSASIKAQKNSYLWFIDRNNFRKAIEENISRNYHQNRKFIEKNPFFQYLTNIQKDKIAGISMTQKFQKNFKLFKEGEIANSMYILKEGTLKRTLNGVLIGYYEKGQSFQEYAVLQKDSLRKQTLVAMTDVQVIALSIEEIEETLSTSIPIIILRNQIKKQLKSHEICSQLSEEYINKILDSFQVRNTLMGERVAHPGLKCKQLIFYVIQGTYDSTNEKNTSLHGLQCFFTEKKEVHYDIDMKFLQEGKIAWTNLYEIEKCLGKSIAKCVSLSSQLKKANIQRKSQLIELKIFTDKYDLNSLQAIKKIGQGQFGTVLLVKNRENGKYYALKCVSKQQTIKYKLEKHLKRQSQILQSLNSPFIVQFIRTFKDSYYIYFLLEYINGLELFDTIRIIGLLNIEQSRFYTAIMVHVLETLHSSNIIYRDLKPQNIMVTKDGYLKIVDLGTCRRFDSQSLHRTFTIIGTPTYMAPQILAGKGYSYNADLWSLGVILYQFLAGYVPFGQDAQDPFQIYQQIISTQLKFPKHMNNTSANMLILQLLSKSPSTRLGGSYSKLKSHHFFNHVDWMALINRQAKAPYSLPSQKFTNEEGISKLPSKPISSYLKKFGKPLSARQDLDCRWDETF